MSGRRSGKVTLITGVAGGMGESHARAMLREGGRVALTDVDDERGHSLADDLGAAASYIHLDVANTAEWAAAAGRVRSAYRRLHVLVNNAGILNFAPIEEYADSAWDLASNESSFAIGAEFVVEGGEAAGPTSD